MIETFREFTFEAAHALPPYSGLHGHSFRVCIYLRGTPDPVFGWAANLYEVDAKIKQIQSTLDHTYLNEIEGLEVPSLENVAQWVWSRLEAHTDKLDRIVLSRGTDGNSEGCIYSGRDRLAAVA